MRGHAVLLHRRVIVAEANTSATSQLLRAHGRHVNEEKSTFDGRRLDRSDWRGLFASGGYYHFLMPMAPGLAITALFGVDALLAHQRRRLAAVLLVGAVLQGLLLVHLWRDGRPHFTLPRDPIVAALDAAFAWQKAERPHAPAVVCHHIYAAYREDWIETPSRRALDALPPADLPVGAVVLWDEKYSDLTGLPLADLRTDPAWTERAEFGGGAVRVFEKMR